MKVVKVFPIRKCCWCGKIRKKGEIGKSCRISSSNIGRKYYWNCGCLDSYNFNEFTELLFEAGLDYPKEFRNP